MSALQEVTVASFSPERFETLLGDRWEEVDEAIDESRRLLKGRVVWHVNSTARGGGVAELLQSLLAYARGAGVDVRWMTISGNPDFFRITKRIHNRLHGAEGDGLALDDGARAIYEQVLADNLPELADRVRAEDVVILHDPQTAGMVDALRATGAAVIWRCHVGLDQPNDLAREAWAFLRPYLEDANAYVFSRESFAWEGLDRDRIAVIAPTIDPFSPKNQELGRDTVRAVLQATGIVAGDQPESVTFERQDGSRGRVERRAQLTQDVALTLETPLVIQVSRWDALKDPLGVIQGFAEHVAADTGAHLLYAGPDVEAVADDPEGAGILREARELRERLPEEARSRVHLATLPMDDPEENAIMVNAIQRHATVVVQKSLAEGFCLTVSEAMWKARPVVASRIGGIQDQVEHGVSGLLVDDPHDLAAYGAAVTELLSDPGRADRMGAQARERVRRRFLSNRSLLDYLELVPV